VHQEDVKMRRTVWQGCVVAVVLVLVAACAAVSEADPESRTLLVPNFDAGNVSVLRPQDRVAGGSPSRTFRFANLEEPCGVAVGPDGRVYVADYAVGTIYVGGLAAALGGGTIPTLAELTSAAVVGPCGIAFDAAGNLWVGDYDAAAVVNLGDPSGLTGAALVTAAAVLAVSSAPEYTSFAYLYDILFDAQGRLWVVDADGVVYRFDAPSQINGIQEVAPSLELRTYQDPATGRWSLNGVETIALDAQGRLYAGTGEGVHRFDGGASLSGVVTDRVPNAFIQTGEDYPSVIVLDSAGRLWVAHWNDDEGTPQALLRIDSPSSGSGVVNANAGLALDWAASGFVEGGRPVFVSTP
jgi:streptogramin lyase